jgi:hypothetical protein
MPEWLPAEHKIGIDLGISDFAITTNDAGESVKYANPKCLYQSEKKVKKAQRALSRKQKGSKNREKARLVLAKKYEKIANQRKHFLHKLSNQITDENQVIVIETLSSRNYDEEPQTCESDWGCQLVRIQQAIGIQSRMERTDAHQGGPILSVQPNLFRLRTSGRQESPTYPRLDLSGLRHPSRSGHQRQQEPLGFGQVKENT